MKFDTLICFLKNIAGMLACKSKVPTGGRVTQVVSEGLFVFCGSEYGAVHMFKLKPRGPNVESLRCF